MKKKIPSWSFATLALIMAVAFAAPATIFAASDNSRNCADYHFNNVGGLTFNDVLSGQQALDVGDKIVVPRGDLLQNEGWAVIQIQPLYYGLAANTGDHLLTNLTGEHFSFI